MSSSRRQVGIDQEEAWIFNRMVEAYAARPAYPPALVETLALAARGQQRVLDLGAGLGHLALPLAERGLPVVAVEPARGMLDRLSRMASDSGLSLSTVHAKAEALPLADASFDLALVADALHFLDVELTAREIDRVLAAGGALAVITASFDDTAFMEKIRAIIDDTAPRRPRKVGAAIQQLFRLTRVRLETEQVFHDATPVSEAQLDEILSSISFVGPAFNPERARRFTERIRALPEARVWARRLELRVGRASRRRRAR